MEPVKLFQYNTLGANGGSVRGVHLRLENSWNTEISELGRLILLMES